MKKGQRYSSGTPRVTSIVEDDRPTWRECLLQFRLAVDGMRPDDFREIVFDIGEEGPRIRWSECGVAHGSFWNIREVARLYSYRTCLRSRVHVRTWPSPSSALEIPWPHDLIFDSIIESSRIGNCSHDDECFRERPRISFENSLLRSRSIIARAEALGRRHSATFWRGRRGWRESADHLVSRDAPLLAVLFSILPSLSFPLIRSAAYASI